MKTEEKKIFEKLMKLMEKEKIEDMSIYYEDKRYSWKENEIKVEENIEINNYIGGNKNKKLGLSYEGRLYRAINRYGEKALLNKFKNVTKGTEICFQEYEAFNGYYTN